MGVIHNFNFLTDSPVALAELEDNLDEIPENTVHDEQVYRRQRKIKHRNPVRPEVSGIRVRNGKRFKHGETTGLLKPVDDEDIEELNIYDFIPKTMSVFSLLLQEREKMKAWNDFINSSDEEQWKILNKTDDQSEWIVSDGYEDCVDDDRRNSHPAFSAEECYSKIDWDLRNTLKKRHIPMGTLIQLEKKLSDFFLNQPYSIYKLRLGNSYERLMVHALCQYMGLKSCSYNENGVRWTKVHNKYVIFHPPPVFLSTFLELRAQRFCRGFC